MGMGNWLLDRPASPARAIGAAVVLALLGLFSCLWANRHRTDAEMTAHFFRHEADFQQLVAMFREDSTVQTIRSGFLDDPSIRWDPAASLASHRYSDYCRVFRVLRVHIGERGNHWGDSADDEITLRATTQWIFDRKGYIYSPSKDLPTVSEETTSSSEGPPVYKRIKEHWYIYFESMS